MSCQLILSNYEGKYSPGTSIEGKVVALYTGCEHMEDIKVTLSGREDTAWDKNNSPSEGISDGRTQSSTRYFGVNKIIDKEIILRSIERVTPGSFEYPFSLELPKDLPNTFKANFGQVCYKLKAAVKFLSKEGYEDVKEIVINSPIDLNQLEYILSGLWVEQSDEKHVDYLCGLCSGLITLNVYLDKQGFVIGEPIKVKAVVTNKSGVDVICVGFELKRILMQKVTTPEIDSKYDTQILNSERFSGVKFDDVKTYRYETRVHDAVSVNNLKTSKLFKEMFSLTVTADLVRDLGNLTVTVDLIIGNIPYTSRPSQDISLSHMNEHSGSPYAPTTEEVGIEAANHMRVPGLTLYPPTAYQPSVTDAVPEQYRPSAPNIETHVTVSRRGRLKESSENSPPPSYHEAVGNPNTYPHPPPS